MLFMEGFLSYLILSGTQQTQAQTSQNYCLIHFCSVNLFNKMRIEGFDLGKFAQQIFTHQTLSFLATKRDSAEFKAQTP